MTRNSTLVWSSTHADTLRAMARVHDAQPHHDPDFHAPLCPTRTPEPHGRGEFPMTCHACHMWADS